MPRSRPPYALEFQRQMVELVRAGRSPEELSREFEPTAQAIRNWVVQAERNEGRCGDGAKHRRARGAASPSPRESAPARRTRYLGESHGLDLLGRRYRGGLPVHESESPGLLTRRF